MAAGSCVSFPAEGRAHQESTGPDGKRLITRAVSKPKDKCGKQTLVENPKHETLEERERPLSRLNVPQKVTHLPKTTLSERNVALVSLADVGLCPPVRLFPRHSMRWWQLKCFAPGLRASFLILQESARLFGPRRSTRETSDAMTTTVIMTSRRRLCLRAAFEVALCGERRQKKGRLGPFPVGSGAFARRETEARRRTDNFFRLI